MKVAFVLCIVLAVSCSALGASGENQVVLVRTRRDLMEHSLKLLQDLIANLRKAAEEALEAVSRFTTGLMTEAGHIRDKILQDIESFKNRISLAADSVYEKFSNVSTSVKACVDVRRSQAAAVFDKTISDTMVCVDKQIAEISDLIQELKTLANNAISDASGAMESMKNCTEANASNLLSTGSCLGALAVQTEIKSAKFLAQSTVTIGRINLKIAGLPVTLEMCAGTQLVQAGVQTGKIIVEIGACSTTAIFNNIIGKA